MANGVLIIDDDEDDCLLIEESLHQVGILERIVSKRGAMDGIRFLEETKDDLPKVIILDLNMPEMNGLEALQEILKRYAVKIIIHTTTCSDETISKVKLLGGFDCVKKGTSYSDNLKFARKVYDLLNAV